MTDPMTHDDDRRAAEQLADYIDETWTVADIHNSTPLTAWHEAFAAHRLAAERRGMERAAGIADKMHKQDRLGDYYRGGDIAATIRAEITNDPLRN